MQKFNYEGRIWENSANSPFITRISPISYDNVLAISEFLNDSESVMDVLFDMGCKYIPTLDEIKSNNERQIRKSKFQKYNYLADSVFVAER